MISAVLDTNVLVSALIKPQGKPAQILSGTPAFELVLSEDILEEARGVLHRKHIRRKYHLDEEKIAGFIVRQRNGARLVVVQHIENIVTNDPPDNLVLATAVEGKADFLVSGNLHLLDLKRHRGIAIVTPAQFLEILTSTKS